MQLAWKQDENLCAILKASWLPLRSRMAASGIPDSLTIVSSTLLYVCPTSHEHTSHACRKVVQNSIESQATILCNFHTLLPPVTD